MEEIRHHLTGMKPCKIMGYGILTMSTAEFLTSTVPFTNPSFLVSIR